MARPKTTKLYVVKKYLMASSINEARQLERKVEPDEIWIDDEWRKNNQIVPTSPLGFTDPPTQNTK